jgi:hypothetical protein
VSCVLVMTDGVWTGEENLQVVITNNYNITADFHIINHSMLSFQSAFTTRCLVTALNNGYSLAMFILDVSW